MHVRSRLLSYQIQELGGRSQEVERLVQLSLYLLTPTT